MLSRHYLGIGDYIVLAISFLICAMIGVIFRFSGNKQKTTNEYLLAGKEMSLIPVILSTTMTSISATYMMGLPAEIYKYGIQYAITPFSLAIGMIIASYVFVPVYFKYGVSTSYEFIELRYGTLTKNVLSGLFILQSVLSMSAVLYAPALALSAVTNLDLIFSIIITGGICTFYCVLGGLKAVIWTDSIQALFMFSCFVAYFIAGIKDGGGIATIYERAKEGGRLNLFNFKVDLITRYTFWNTLLQGIVSSAGMYGTSQLEIQRILSIRESKKAMQALQLSTIPMFIMQNCCIWAGVVLYSLYYLCDPVLDKENTGLASYDQIFPYYLVNRFSSMPGLTGFCISGIFSGSLSTVSSGVNSMTTVTIVNFLQPLFPNFTEKRCVFWAKLCSLFYGLLFIGITFAFMKVQSVRQLAAILWSIIEGPSTAIFLIGILTQKISEKCALIGLVVGIIFSSWIGFGSLFSGYVEPSLPLNISNCVGNTSTPLTTTFIHFEYQNRTLSNSPNDFSDIFIFYKVSYMWNHVIGFLVTSAFVFIAVLITGWKNTTQSADNKNAVLYTPVGKIADQNLLKS